ncbi:branched-chain amino acid ABC transporter permease [Agromyces sp. NBRC 114283]|jgi:branched-chain amino acid transport system permease protein|uniref:Branched-chain amino acid ABC transporter permease n=2 Tax=Bacteria TaxID=2 RepID=A0A918F779_AGRME|nr:branched-chain amino acid ABC transporter permease [Agromyces mediolanus]GLJ73520.1 branched-chain amino acid ABC transporter permease [Agromyces mediolanus]GLU89158.1 branched-chain amino acid ABC transporter permease [Agromyces sp. NBRC 114283]
MIDWGSIFSNAAVELISPTTAAYALAALGLAVHFGYTGLLNFGQAGFMAIGAYGYAISVLTFGFPVWGAVLVGIGASIVFALILGIPTLRLRADYLAIVTIAAAEIVRLLFTTNTFVAVTGSANGLSEYKGGFRALNPLSFEGKAGFGPWMFSANDWWNIIVGWSVVILAVLFTWLLMRSPWGRVIKGIREDEDAVRALGKNVYSYKMQSLIIGGVFGTLAGMIFIMPRAVIPSAYATSLTFFIWAILLLGGAATILGPVLGSIVFWVLLSFFSGFIARAVEAGWFPISEVQAGQLRFILVGVAIMLLVIFRPQGLLGNKKEMSFVK